MSRIIAAIGAPDYPVLDGFIQCRERISVIRGPLGSGKTMGCVQRIMAQMCEQPPNPEGTRPTRWLVVRNTYGDLLETTIKDFLEIFDGLGTMRYGGTSPPCFKAAWHMDDGTTVRSEVIFQALDRPDSIKKLKGHQVSGIWINELCEIPRGIVDMADLRHGRYPKAEFQGVDCGWSGMLGDTNSFDADHWLYQIEQEDPEGWSFFIQPGGVLETDALDDFGRRVFVPNPAAENIRNLKPDYYKQGMSGKTEMWIRVMLANRHGFLVNGKPVHPQYNDALHCAAEPIQADRRYPLVVGQDFGRTPAATILQYLDHLGRWVLLDELTSQDMSASLFGPELKRKLDREYPRFRISGWGDPAGDAQGQATEDTPILIMRAAGVPMQPAPTNNWALRKAALDNVLTRLCMDGRPAFMISPRAKQARKALQGGYQYRELQVTGPEKRYSDTPEKNFSSHVAESIHYALLGGGEGREALMPSAARGYSDEPVQAYYQ